MLFAALIERFVTWRRERETLTQLKRLNPRDLEDIGVDAFYIPHIARMAARA